MEEQLAELDPVLWKKGCILVLKSGLH